MTVLEYETEEELDDTFDQIEAINMRYLDLKEAVEQARKDLLFAEEELLDFEEDNKEYLL